MFMFNLKMRIYNVCLIFQITHDHKSEDDKLDSDPENLKNFDLNTYLRSLNLDDLINKFNSDLYSILPDSVVWGDYQDLSFKIETALHDPYITEEYIKDILYDKYYEDESFWNISNLHKKHYVYKYDYRNEYTSVKIEN